MRRCLIAACVVTCAASLHAQAPSPAARAQDAQQPIPAAPLEVAWKFPAPGGFYAAPTVVGNLVYAAGQDGVVYCLDAATSKPEWRYKTPARLYAGVAANENYAVAASTDKNLYGFAAKTGRLLWHRELDGILYATPLLVGNTVYQGTGESGTVYALDAATGEVRWTYAMGGRLGSGVTRVGDKLYMGSHDHKLHVVDAANGHALWTFPTDGIVDSIPLVVDKVVYIKLPNDTVYAVDDTNGRQLWKHTAATAPVPADQVSNWSTLVLSRGLLLFGSIDYGLYALDAKTGEQRWKHDGGDSWPSGPAVVGRTGIAGNKDGSLTFVDLRRGEATGRWTTPQPQGDPYLRGIMWPPVVVGERLYAGSMDGNLYAFTLKLGANGEGPASTLTAKSLTAAKVVLHDVAAQAGTNAKVACSLDVDGTWPAGATVGLISDADAQGNEHVWMLTATTARLLRQDSAGHETVLAEGMLTAPPQDLTLARDGRKLRLLADDRCVLTAYDDLPPGRLAAGASSAGVTVSDAHVQPTEAVYFTDDFMRVAGGHGDWTPRSGTWGASGVSEENVDNPDKRPNPNFSSNPFAYRASDVDKTALAVAGQWHWDTYRAGISVRPGAAIGPEAAIGIAGYVKDPANYIAFEWGHGAGKVRRLVVVRDGKPEVLASAEGSWVADQWYRLGLSLLDGKVTATLDGQDVLSAACDDFGQGAIGLLARQVSFADFDDAEVIGSSDLVDPFGPPVAGLWRGISGEWALDPTPRGPAGEGLRFLKSNGDGVVVTGDDDWSNYKIATQARAGDGGGVGLVADWRDAKNCVELQWRDKLALVLVADGAETTLAEAAVPAPHDRWSKLELTSRDGFLTAGVDGETKLEAYAPGAGIGRAGLWARGVRSGFAGCAVSFVGRHEEVEFAPEVAPQFSQEELMASWAQPEGAWWLEGWTDRDGIVWYRSDVYGPVAIHIDAAKAFGNRQRKLTLTVAAERRKADTGYALSLTQAKDDSRDLDLELRCRGQQVAKASAKLADAKLLTFTRRKGCLVVQADGKPMLTWQDTRDKLEDGPQVALQSSQPRFDLGRVVVDAENSYDTTFVRAPVEWWEAKGIWETTNRWKCDPRWSFFGGHSDLNPTIWTKDSYAGDVQIDAFMGIKMDQKSHPHYLHPSDLSVALCGDGKQVDSGYAFLFAAKNNTCSQLFKNGKMVAQNDSDDARFRYASDDGEGLTEFHRHWFHLVLRKAGGRLLAQVDDRTIFDVADPDPLPSGKAAVFCVNNGMMITRAKIAYERRAAPQSPTDTAAMVASADRGGEWTDAFHNDFETGIGPIKQAPGRSRVLVTRSKEAASGKLGLQLTNLISGGSFPVSLGVPAFRVGEHPVLKFAYKIPKTVRLNLYVVLASGEMRVIRLNGGEQVFPGQQITGKVADWTADNEWHRAKIDLAAALATTGLDANQNIQSLVFAMLEPDPYLSAAFGVNPLGATWCLDDLSLDKD